MKFSLIMFSWSAMDGHFKREVLQMQPFRGESYMKPQKFWLDTMIAYKLIFHVARIDLVCYTAVLIVTQRFSPLVGRSVSWRH